MLVLYHGPGGVVSQSLEPVAGGGALVELFGDDDGESRLTIPERKNPIYREVGGR